MFKAHFMMPTSKLGAQCYCILCVDEKPILHDGRSMCSPMDTIHSCSKLEMNG